MTNISLGQSFLFRKYTYDLHTMMAFDLKPFDVKTELSTMYSMNTMVNSYKKSRK